MTAVVLQFLILASLHAEYTLSPAAAEMVSSMAHNILFCYSFSQRFALSPLVSIFVNHHSTITREFKVVLSLSISLCHDYQLFSLSTLSTLGQLSPAPSQSPISSHSKCITHHVSLIPQCTFLLCTPSIPLQCKLANNYSLTSRLAILLIYHLQIKHPQDHLRCSTIIASKCITGLTWLNPPRGRTPSTAHLTAEFYHNFPFFRPVVVLLWIYYHIPECVWSPLGCVSHLCIAQYHSALTLSSSPQSGGGWFRFGCVTPVTTIYDMQYLWW